MSLALLVICLADKRSWREGFLGWASYIPNYAVRLQRFKPMSSHLLLTAAQMGLHHNGSPLAAASGCTAFVPPGSNDVRGASAPAAKHAA